VLLKLTQILYSPQSVLPNNTPYSGTVARKAILKKKLRNLKVTYIFA